MAYADPFDPVTPPGSEERSKGDDRIRELKRALIQRLDTLVNFSTSADPVTDPLVLHADSVNTAQIKDHAVTSVKLIDAVIDARTKFAAPILANIYELRSAAGVPPGIPPFTVAANTLLDIPVSVTGVLAGDLVLFQPGVPVSNGARECIATVKSVVDGTVTLSFYNPTSGTVTVYTTGDSWKFIFFRPAV